MDNTHGSMPCVSNAHPLKWAWLIDHSIACRNVLHAAHLQGCTVDTTTGQCSAISSTDVAIVKPSYIPPATNVFPKLLVLLVNAPACGSSLPSTASVSSISQLYFGPNLDGKGGWAFKAENCSYGEVQVDVPNSMVMTVSPTCTW